MLPIYLNGLILQNPKHSVFVMTVVLIPVAEQCVTLYYLLNMIMNIAFISTVH